MTSEPLANLRAQFAWKKINEVKTSDDASVYKSIIKKMPMLIKNNGLGGTLAFLKSKKKVHQKVMDDIEEWLRKRMMISNNIIDSVINAATPEYRALSNEVMELLMWMRRFADGLIEGEAND